MRRVDSRVGATREGEPESVRIQPRVHPARPPRTTAHHPRPSVRGLSAPSSDGDDQEAISLAIDRLEGVNERAARVVKLKYYIALTHEEIAEILGCSVKLVQDEWSFGKAWLRLQLGRE